MIIVMIDLKVFFLRYRAFGLLFIYLNINWAVVFSQAINNYAPPLDIPLLLSANFGDVRSGSFHFGLDFRTPERIGYNVYSIANGYVSRVKIEPGGYGKAVYIEHTNGKSTVYGHLESISGALSWHVENEQYKKESFAIDLIFEPNQFPVKKGQIIGLSGNSGSSTGPHLHFEIRDSKNQNPLHPLVPDWNITDNSAPKINGLFIYSWHDFMTNGLMPRKNYKISGSNGKYNILHNGPVPFPAKAFIGLDMFDFITDSHRKLSFYSCRLFIDSLLFFEYTFDELRFGQMNQVNACIDYGRRADNRNNLIYTLVKWPNQDIIVIKKALNNGIIECEPDKIYHFRIELSDIHGNTSELNFLGRAGTPADDTIIPISITGNYVDWQKGAILNHKNYMLEIPANSLYADAYIDIDSGILKNGFLAPPVNIGSKRIMPKLPFKLKFNATTFSSDVQRKMLFVTIDEKGNKASAGGEIKGQYLEMASRIFGTYAVAIDTIPPEIRWINISENKNMNGIYEIRVKISDNLSGIADYRGTINNKWVLFDYDAKNNLLAYKFQPKRLPLSKGRHNLKIVVSDKKGNITEASVNFVK